MSSTDGLNAGASTFTPGGGGAVAALAAPPALETYHDHGDDVDDEEEEVLRALEAERHNADMDDLTAHMAGSTADISDPPTLPPNGARSGAGAAPAPALPSHLAKHASEFWFPECRDCACCHGYKFGCPSCGGGTCKCSGGGGGGGGAPQQQYQAPAAGGRGGGRNQSHQGRGGRGHHQQRQGSVPCKFFQSPGGCRFGDKCRFAHY